MRVHNPNQQNTFSQSDLYKSFNTDSDHKIHLCSSALIFYVDWDFSLGHMSMDLSSVLAALSSHGVPSVNGTNMQVASPQGYDPVLAGIEPSHIFIHPGQQLHTLATQKRSDTHLAWELENFEDLATDF